ncbi:MAG: hypothetical protein JSS78_09120 [Bacteroidetes bacterium]|nr:hypothetical protein [Bacteroidota bacterium]
MKKINATMTFSKTDNMGVPLRVGLSAAIFFSCLKKGFPLLSLTQKQSQNHDLPDSLDNQYFNSKKSKQSFNTLNHPTDNKHTAL